jgi:diguanylate cyclase (GGDEF)-like protein
VRSETSQNLSAKRAKCPTVHTDSSRSARCSNLRDVEDAKNMPPIVARAFALAILVLTATATSAAASEQTQILYGQPGVPQLVIGPSRAERMTVTVRGTTRIVGRAFPVGGSFLGHAVDAAALPNDLRADEPIVVRVEPAGLPPARIVPVDDAVRTAVAAARAGGIVLGVLFTIALLQIITLIVTREPSIPWYIGLIGSLAGVALARDGLLPIDPGAPIILALDLVGMLCGTGLVVTYLRLWSEARALFWALVGACTASVAIGMSGLILTGFRSQAEALRVPLVCVFCIALLTVVIVRARRFPPAWILFGGTALLVASTAYRALRTHIGTPFFDHWAFELGATLDSLVFATAIVARVRYAIFERRAIERRLNEATYEASHDALTGALNRRGLFARVGGLSGNLFAIDLDGFKQVNDRFGHATGDIVLRDVVQALRGLVAATDIVARVGGDEFVVITAEATGDPTDLAQAFADAIASVQVEEEPELRGRLGASVGSASLTGRTLDAALALADARAYRMKATHRAAAG